MGVPWGPRTTTKQWFKVPPCHSNGNKHNQELWQLVCADRSSLVRDGWRSGQRIACDVWVPAWEYHRQTGTVDVSPNAQSPETSFTRTQHHLMEVFSLPLEMVGSESV